MDKKFISILGERITYFRKKNGYSRAEVAEKLGISQRTLASYERGEREMSIQTALALTDLYNVTISMLTDNKKIMNDDIE